ncbi:hypothetical protein IFE17_09945 [Actinobacillus sp. GY-402]|nr:hypothetical protein IFE17_09325 [Actinobacillus sp. GY-402]QOF67440.1 hypothetical protein IFE17_09945 [Actinobacillus sp. GY-402]
MSGLFKVKVQNKIKDGYCRAGRILPIGDSVLDDVTEEQLAALQGDHRLVVGTPEPVEVENVLPADLTKLTVEQLKAALTARGVQFGDKAVKADLVALLTAATTPPAQDGE